MDDWLTWIAFAALIAGFGLFLDKYHIGEGQKAWLRRGLKRVWDLIYELPKRFKWKDRPARPLSANADRFLAILAILSVIVWIGGIIWFSRYNLAVANAEYEFDLTHSDEANSIPWWLMATLVIVGSIIQSFTWPLMLVIAVGFLLAIPIYCGFMCLYIAQLIRLLLLHVLGVASDPKHSPIAYASAVIGIFILLGKALHALLT